jgi:hypothetical protein
MISDRLWSKYGLIVFRYVSKNDLSFQTASLCGRSQTDFAELWLKQTVFLLTQPPVPSSTQALQTLVFSSHFCTQIEGFTGNFGLLSTSFLQMAKSMKLHRLDIAMLAQNEKRTALTWLISRADKEFDGMRSPLTGMSALEEKSVGY